MIQSENDNLELFPANIFPQFSSSFGTDSVSNKTMIEVEPNNDMLAVKYSQDSFVFKEMKESALNDCEMMKEKYVCQENIYFRKGHTSCLKSMFFQTRYESLLNDCKVFAKTDKRRVIKVSQNTFIFAFPETAYYNKICNGSVLDQKVKLEGDQKIFIHDSCRLEFTDFYVKPSEGFEVENKIKFAFFNRTQSYFLEISQKTS